MDCLQIWFLSNKAYKFKVMRYEILDRLSIIDILSISFHKNLIIFGYIFIIVILSIEFSWNKYIFLSEFLAFNFENTWKSIHGPFENLVDTKYIFGRLIQWLEHLSWIKCVGQRDRHSWQNWYRIVEGSNYSWEMQRLINGSFIWWIIVTLD